MRMGYPVGKSSMKMGRNMAQAKAGKRAKRVRKAASTP